MAAKALTPVTLNPQNISTMEKNNQIPIIFKNFYTSLNLRLYLKNMLLILKTLKDQVGLLIFELYDAIVSMYVVELYDFVGYY